MSNTQYTAFTIGPIYNTFAQAKRTRSVWAASYFFSWFIKQVVIRAKSPDSGFTILLPYSSDIANSSYGSGLYADRVYFEPSQKTEKDLKAIIESIIAEIAKDIDKDNHVAVHQFLKEYLNIHVISIECSNKSDVLKKINDQLDLQELTKRYAFDYESNPLFVYLDKKLTDGSLLVKDAFNNTKGLRFRSLPEIASASLERTEQAAYISLINSLYKLEKQGANIDVDFWEELKKNEVLNKLQKPHHKYYAVLYADGDNIGTLLTQISGEFNELQKFSELIFSFGKRAEKIIHQYGGSGIYLGGEDILAFLPLACVTAENPRTQTIFHIVEQLDILFRDTIGQYAISKGVTAPTLSYGITVAYIKHPLKEAMRNAHEQLEQIKKGKNDDGSRRFPDKNTVGLCFQKHSGQKINCYIEKKHTKSTENIYALVQNYTINVNIKNAELLSGVIHRLKDPLFFETFMLAARANRLTPFFANFFDEEIHTGENNPKNQFLEAVRAFAETVFSDYTDNDKCRDILYTILRIIHFINSDKE